MASAPEALPPGAGVRPPERVSETKAYILSFVSRSRAGRSSFHVLGHSGARPRSLGPILPSARVPGDQEGWVLPRRPVGPSGLSRVRPPRRVELLSTGDTFLRTVSHRNRVRPFRFLRFEPPALASQDDQVGCQTEGRIRRWPGPTVVRRGPGRGRPRVLRPLEPGQPSPPLSPSTQAPTRVRHGSPPGRAESHSDPAGPSVTELDPFDPTDLADAVPGDTGHRFGNPRGEVEPQPREGHEEKSSSCLPGRGVSVPGHGTLSLSPPVTRLSCRPRTSTQTFARSQTSGSGLEPPGDSQTQGLPRPTARSRPFGRGVPSSHSHLS